MKEGALQREPQLLIPEQEPRYVSLSSKSRSHFLEIIDLQIHHFDFVLLSSVYQTQISKMCDIKKKSIFQGEIIPSIALLCMTRMITTSFI